VELASNISSLEIRIPKNSKAVCIKTTETREYLRAQDTKEKNRIEVFLEAGAARSYVEAQC
jgi:hypothetical protein